MATQLQIRRGTAAQVAAFTGAEGEIVYNSTNDSLHTNDGATAGGFELARADLNNVSDADLNAALTGNTLSALTITTLTATGGTIDGTTIGATTPASVAATTLSTTGAATFSGNVGIAGQASPTYKLDGGFADQTWGWYLNSSYNAGFTFNTTERSLLIHTKSAENIDHIKFATGGTGAERMRIDGASGNVGIGTSAPQEKTHSAGRILSTTQYGSPTQRIGTSIGENGNTKADIDFRRWTGAAANHGVGMIDVADTGVMAFYTDTKTSNTPATTERMRIAGAEVHVGHTGATPPFVMTGTAFGISLYGSGGFISAARSGAEPLLLNRTSSDGAIINLRKDGASVGSIGTLGGNLFIGSPNGTAAHLRLGEGGVFPSDGGGYNRNAAIDLGGISSKFKDLYLSGGVYLGGTGAANKLDDYEEGTWTPTFANLTGVSSAEGSYVKIGNLVTVSVAITSSGTTVITLNSSRITNLPFTISTTGGGRYIGSFTDISASSGLYGTHTISGTTAIFTSSVSTGGIVAGSFTYRVA